MAPPKRRSSQQRQSGKGGGNNLNSPNMVNIRIGAEDEASDVIAKTVKGVETLGKVALNVANKSVVPAAELIVKAFQGVEEVVNRTGELINNLNTVSQTFLGLPLVEAVNEISEVIAGDLEDATDSSLTEILGSFSSFGKQAVEGVRESTSQAATQGAGNAVADAVQTAQRVAQNAVGQAQNAIGQVASSGAGKVVGQAAQNAQKVAQNAVEKAREVATDAAQNAQQAIRQATAGQAGQVVTGAVKEAQELAQNAAQNAQQAVRKATAGGAGQVVTGAVGEARQVATRAAQQAQEQFAKVAGSETGQAVTGAVQTAAQNAQAIASRAVKEARQTASNLAQTPAGRSATQSVEATRNAIEERLPPGVASAVGNATQQARQQASQVARSSQQVTAQASQQAQQVARQAVQASRQTGQQIAQQAQRTASQVATQAQQQAEQISQSAQEIASQASQRVQQAGQQISQSASQVAQQVAQSASQVTQQAGRASTEVQQAAQESSSVASQSANQIGRSFLGALGRIADTADRTFLDVQRGINKTVSTVSQFTDMAGSAVGAFSGLTEFQTIFGGIKNSVSGALQGVSQITQEIFFFSEALGVLQQFVATGPYQLLIQQNVELQQQLIETQSSLVATQKVMRDGGQIEDPKTAILALEQPMLRIIEKIKRDSLELVGVTSKELVGVFNIVAGQAANIGISLEESSDLVISFSAAIGTMGLPMHQMRQEVTSILQGTIDMNSVLAKNLNIRNEDISKMIAQGKLYDYLQKKLEAFTAGNALSAKTMAGVTSNIQEMIDIIGQRTGAPLLEFLVEELNKTYEFVQKNFSAFQAFADRIGAYLTTILKNAVASIKLVFGTLGEVAGSVTIYIFDFLAKAVEMFRKGLEELLPVIQPIINTFGALVKVALAIASSLASTPILKYAIQLKILSQAVTLAKTAFGTFLNVTPLVGEALYLMGLRSEGAIGLFSNLTKILQQFGLRQGAASAAGILTFARNLEKIPFAADAVTKQLTAMLGPFALLVPQLTGAIPKLATFSIALISMSQKFPFLQKGFQVLRSSLPGLATSLAAQVSGFKNAAAAATELGKRLPFLQVAFSQLQKVAPNAVGQIAGELQNVGMGNLANQVEAVGNSLATMSTAQGAAAASTNVLKQSVKAFKAQLIATAAFVAKWALGLGAAFLVIDDLILKNEAAMDAIRFLFDWLKKIVKFIQDVLTQPIVLVTAAILAMGYAIKTGLIPQLIKMATEMMKATWKSLVANLNAAVAGLKQIQKTISGINLKDVAASVVNYVKQFVAGNAAVQASTVTSSAIVLASNTATQGALAKTQGAMATTQVGAVATQRTFSMFAQQTVAGSESMRAAAIRLLKTVIESYMGMNGMIAKTTGVLGGVEVKMLSAAKASASAGAIVKAGISSVVATATQGGSAVLSVALPLQSAIAGVNTGAVATQRTFSMFAQQTVAGSESMRAAAIRLLKTVIESYMGMNGMIAKTTGVLGGVEVKMLSAAKASASAGAIVKAGISSVVATATQGGSAVLSVVQSAIAGVNTGVLATQRTFSMFAQQTVAGSESMRAAAIRLLKTVVESYMGMNGMIAKTTGVLGGVEVKMLSAAKTSASAGAIVKAGISSIVAVATQGGSAVLSVALSLQSAIAGVNTGVLALTQSVVAGSAIVQTAIASLAQTSVAGYLSMQGAIVPYGASSVALTKAVVGGSLAMGASTVALAKTVIASHLAMQGVMGGTQAMLAGTGAQALAMSGSVVGGQLAIQGSVVTTTAVAVTSGATVQATAISPIIAGLTAIWGRVLAIGAAIKGLTLGAIVGKLLAGLKLILGSLTAIVAALKAGLAALKAMLLPLLSAAAPFAAVLGAIVAITEAVMLWLDYQKGLNKATKEYRKAMKDARMELEKIKALQIDEGGTLGENRLKEIAQEQNFLTKAFDAVRGRVGLTTAAQMKLNAEIRGMGNVFAEMDADLEDMRGGEMAAQLADLEREKAELERQRQDAESRSDDREVKRIEARIEKKKEEIDAVYGILDAFEEEVKNVTIVDEAGLAQQKATLSLTQAFREELNKIGQVELEALDLLELGSQLEQIEKKAQGAWRNIENPTGDPQKFQAAADEFVAMEQQLLSLGATVEEDVIPKFRQLSQDIRLDMASQSKAYQALQAALKSASEKRIAVIEEEQNEIGRLRAEGAISQFELETEQSVTKIAQLREGINLQMQLYQEAQAFGDVGAQRTISQEIVKQERELAEALKAERDRLKKERVNDYDEQLKILEGNFAKGMLLEVEYNEELIRLQREKADEQISQLQSSLAKLAGTDKEGREAILAEIAEIEKQKIDLIAQSNKMQRELLDRQIDEVLDTAKQANVDRQAQRIQAFNQFGGNMADIGLEQTEDEISEMRTTLEQERARLSQMMNETPLSDPKAEAQRQGEIRDQRIKTSELTLSLLEKERSAYDQLTETILANLDREQNATLLAIQEEINAGTGISGRMATQEARDRIADLQIQLEREKDINKQASLRLELAKAERTEARALIDLKLQELQLADTQARTGLKGAVNEGEVFSSQLGLMEAEQRLEAIRTELSLEKDKEKRIQLEEQLVDTQKGLVEAQKSAVLQALNAENTQEMTDLLRQANRGDILGEAVALKAAEDRLEAVSKELSLEKDKEKRIQLEQQVVEAEKGINEARKALALQNLQIADTQSLTQLKSLLRDSQIIQEQFQVASAEQQLNRTKTELSLEKDKAKRVALEQKIVDDEMAIIEARKALAVREIQLTNTQELTQLKRLLNQKKILEEQYQVAAAEGNVERIRAELALETDRAKKIELQMQLVEAQGGLIEANINLYKAQLDRETLKYENAIKRQNKALEKQANVIDLVSKAVEMRNKLMSAQQSLYSATTDYFTGGLEAIAKMERSDRRRAKINELIAAVRLKTAVEQAKYEQKSLEIQQLQQRIALEREAIEKRIAANQAAVDEKKAKNALLVGLKRGLPQEEIEALNLEYESAKEISALRGVDLKLIEEQRANLQEIQAMERDVQEFRSRGAIRSAEAESIAAIGSTGRRNRKMREFSEETISQMTGEDMSRSRFANRSQNQAEALRDRYGSLGTGTRRSEPVVQLPPGMTPQIEPNGLAEAFGKAMQLRNAAVAETNISPTINFDVKVTGNADGAAIVRQARPQLENVVDRMVSLSKR